MKIEGSRSGTASWVCTDVSSNFQMARTITTMTRRDLKRNQYRESIEAMVYDFRRGIAGHVERLNQLFWKLEREEFPILDNYRIWALVRSLPKGKGLYDEAHGIWGRHEGRVTYAQLYTELIQYAEALENPEELEGSSVGSVPDAMSWHHPEDIPTTPENSLIG